MCGTIRLDDIEIGVASQESVLISQETASATTSDPWGQIAFWSQQAQYWFGALGAEYAPDPDAECLLEECTRNTVRYARVIQNQPLSRVYPSKMSYLEDVFELGFRAAEQGHSFQRAVSEFRQKRS